MGYTKVKPYKDIREQFRQYCIKYGFNESNCIRPKEDTTYDELFDTYRERVKHKPDSYDAYTFSYYAGRELEKRSAGITKLYWGPDGYKAFLVFHPTRTINAPMYGDRVVEAWYTQKYIAPYFEDKLSPKNLACQKNKGPHVLLLMMEESLKELWKKYGNDFWFLQTDFEGYYDNLSHEWIKKCFEGIDPYAYFLFCRTIDSWEETEGDSNKYYSEGKETGKRYGVPKGNLPSQWAGIVNLNGLDHLLPTLPGYLDGYRYMDDSIHFFPDKEGTKKCKESIENYLRENKVGIRLHPRKTHYAPIKQGFNFCGWHFRIREDGSVEIKVRQDRKKLKKRQLKGMQKAYKKGRLSFEEVQESVSSVFAHYHTGDTKRLRKYIINRFTFEKEDEDGKKTIRHLRDLKRKTRTEKQRLENNKALNNNKGKVTRRKV